MIRLHSPKVGGALFFSSKQFSEEFRGQLLVDMNDLDLILWQMASIYC